MPPPAAEMGASGSAPVVGGGGAATGMMSASASASASAAVPRRAASTTTSSSSSCPPRGAFIVLEGVDRCGKTTQCAKLVERLRASGIDAELWRFPDRTTEIGKMIDAYLSRSAELDDAAVHLLFSANRWEKRAELLRALASGTTVVCDRYAFSGVAFTSAKEAKKEKDGMIEGEKKEKEGKQSLLSFEWCSAPDEGLPAPDAVLYLDLDPREAAQRGGFGEERYESDEMLRRVRERFERIAERVDGRCTRWTKVDAAGTIDEVAERVAAVAVAAVERVMGSGRSGGEGEGGEGKGRAPLRALWDEGATVVGWPPAPSSSSGPLS